MKKHHTLTLNASSLGSSAARGSEPEQDVEAAPVQPARSQEPRTPQRQGESLKIRLLTLAGVTAVATSTAVAATGSIHSPIFRIAAAGLAIAVAAVVAIEIVVPRLRSSAALAAAPVAVAPPARHAGLNKSKILLLMIMVAGFATYFGNGGSFASFSADTTNANSNIASGTLTLSNNVNSQATSCFSYNGAANVNSSCQNYFSLAGGTLPNTSSAAGNLGPSLYGSVAQLTVENDGSIDASKLELYAPTTTDCTDSKAATNQVSGATVGNTLTFNTGSLCGSAIMYVQEIGTGHHYCWFGAPVPGQGTNPAACAAPFSVAYAGGATVAASGNILYSGTSDGNIVAGDKIHISQLNASTQTYNVAECTATGSAPAVDVWMGDTTGGTTGIPVTGCTMVSGVNGAFTTAAVVTDFTTTSSTLAGTFTADTISNFDTSYGSLLSALPIWPVTSDGHINNSGYGIALPKYDSTNHTSARKFYIGVYLPTPATTNQNTLQGLQSAFNLTWHIEQ